MNLDQHLQNLTRQKIPSDLERILDMPRQGPQDGQEAADYWNTALGLGGASLRPEQALALSVIEKRRGGFFMYGVGFGKTLIALLAGTAAGSRSPVVLVPPALVKQMEQEAVKWSRFFKFRTPAVVSYGLLSTRRGLLEELKPDLIIADEAHNLKDKKSVKTRRFLRYFNRNPRCGFVALSGTMTSKSLLDYAHLLELSLRERAPIPFNRYELERWAACVDPDGEPNQSDLNRLSYLVQWAHPSKLTPTNKETIRSAYRTRLTTTPGVLATVRSSCDASLIMQHHKPRHTQAIKDALKTLREKWEKPDGEPIADASQASATFKNLCTGFYYRWDWGENGPDLEWLEAKRHLNRLIGKVLRYSPREGRDSPALVTDWSRNGGGTQELREAVRLWDEVGKRPGPKNVAVWLCQEKLKYALQYAYNSSDPVLLWYSSNALGSSLARLGVDVRGAGSLPPSGGLAACSIAVHGAGRNLQMYRKCLVIEPPASGSIWEQLLGRTHRSGQQADAVQWDFMDYAGSVAKAKTHAEYVEQTTGTRQKLNYATILTTGQKAT